MAVQQWANDLEIYDFLDDLLFDGRTTYSADARSALAAGKIPLENAPLPKQSSSSSSSACPVSVSVPVILPDPQALARASSPAHLGRPQPYGPKPKSEAHGPSADQTKAEHLSVTSHVEPASGKAPRHQHNCGVVSFRLCEYTQAGKVLKHCTSLVDSVLALYPGCVIFKIGVAVDPVRRYFDKSIG